MCHADPVTSPSAPELEYIERFARLFEDSGSSRIMGRIFAWLMICEPPEQSQPELAARLGVSKASVSTEVRALMSRGLVERTTRPGDRRSYYQIPAGGWAALLERRLRRGYGDHELLGAVALEDGDAEHRRADAPPPRLAAGKCIKLTAVISLPLPAHRKRGPQPFVRKRHVPYEPVSTDPCGSCRRHRLRSLSGRLLR